MFSTAQQAAAFLLSVYAGIASGAVYDILGCVRRLFRNGGLLCALMDLLFWCVSAALVALAAAMARMESFRFYTALGALCGFLIWKCGIGKILNAGLCALQYAGKRTRRAETQNEGAAQWRKKTDSENG